VGIADTPEKGRQRTVVIAAFLAGWLSQPAAAQDTPSLDEIVDRAVARAEAVHEQERQYRFRMLSTIDKLHKSGGIQERTEDVHELVRIDGKPYLRLIERNGEPLTPEALEKERKRQERFRKRIRKGKRPRSEEDEIILDRDLADRYDARVTGVEPIGGRPAYAISFRPKPGKLPERRRIDRTLNNSRGRIWVDQQTYEVARLEFELTAKVRFWWFMGSISELRGYYAREPLDGIWLPAHGELRIDARAIFRSIRRNHKAVWTDFQPWPQGPGAAEDLERPGR